MGGVSRLAGHFRTQFRRTDPPLLPWATLLVLSAFLLSGIPFAGTGGSVTTGALSASSLRGAGGSPGAAEIQHAAHSLQGGAGPAHGHPLTCHGDGARASGACRASSLPEAVNGLAAPAPGWKQARPGPPAQADYAFWMTYDAADGYVLLFGAVSDLYGFAGATDTWSFQGGNWSSIDSSPAPQPCSGSALTYDDADGYVLFLVSSSSYYSASCTSAGQTWTYHAGAWTQLHPTTSPIPRYGASMANDTKDGYVLLFGGVNRTNCGSGYCNDTWKFSGGNWTQLFPSTAPANRSDAGLAYDAADGYMVLFGGTSTYPNSYLDDTWSFVNGNWTALHPAQSPPVPSPDAFSYDGWDQVILYTNALNWTRGAQEIAWTFHAGNWTNAALPKGPFQRLGAATAYDVRDGFVLMFGGRGSRDLNDTWSFRVAGWTDLTKQFPTPRESPGLTYDAADGYVLLFGGYCSTYSAPPYCPYRNDTWTYAKGVWTELFPSVVPPGRVDAGMVYDAADGYVVLFGGVAATGWLNDTWEFTAGSWVQLTPTRAPSPRDATDMVYDGGDGDVLLFSAYRAGNLGDTWTYHAGSWTDRTSTISVSPPSGTPNPMTYDAASGYVLLFGTLIGQSTSSVSFDAQTWKYSGGTWTNLTPTATGAPSARGDAALAYDPANASDILFGGTSGVGDTYAFKAGNWTQLFPSTSPPAQSHAALTYDAADSAGLLVGGAAPADLWVWERGVGSRPYIRSFAASPGVVDVGGSTNLTATAGGGVAPLTYSYGGLPAGCASHNVSVLLCVPSVIGTFGVSLSVTDSAGNHSFATAYLTVNPVPTLTSFSVSPSTITLGGGTILSASAAGGTSPYSYTYSGLPPGCPSQTIPSLPCTPTSAGLYLVRVNLTDAFGLRASAATNLTVNAAGGSGMPLISAFAATPAAMVLGNSTNLSVTASGGTGTLSYNYSGLPTGCATNDTSRLPCSPTITGTFTVTVTATDALGSATSVATDVTVFPAGGGLGALIHAFGASPGTLGLGQTTAFVVVATGGSGPLSYRFDGLPTGCTSANLAQLPCTPLVVGPFLVRVTVSDSAHHAVSVGTHLLVRPASGGNGGPSPLQVTTFYPTPAVVRVGETTILEVSVRGESGAPTYTYFGLPTGCVSTDTPTLPCAPSGSGNFTITVHVSDPTGASATASTPLVVSGPTTSPPTGNLTGSGNSALGYLPIAVAALAGALGGAALTRLLSPGPPSRTLDGSASRKP